MATVIRSSIDFTRVFDILAYQRDRYPNSKALSIRVHDRWFSYSINTLSDKIDTISLWLLKQGLIKGDRVVLFPYDGTPDWVAVDFACQQIGVISVILYPTLNGDEITRIVAEVKPKLVICEDVTWYEAHQGLFSVPFYHFDRTHPRFFNALEDHFVPAIQLINLHHLADEIKPDEVFCILYTSGSTGESKGVMLTHSNVVHNIKAILSILPITSDYRVISFLPFSHIFERVSCYAYMAFGVSIYFSRDKSHFARDFKSVKPHCCTSVPRVLEKMYEFVELKSLSASFIKRKVIQWALAIGEQYHDRTAQSFLYPFQLFLARRLVLSRWRKALGGKIEFMVVGAAALRPEIGRLFTAGGIRIIEAYGMTEMAPLIAINRVEPGLQRWGTVGLAIPGVEIKIDNNPDNPEGEILVKGPNLMRGYYNKDELTQSMMTADGWFHTGDVGKLIDGKFLHITDRKKDLFKTSAGKYIAPLPLQNHFTHSPYIERCLILGFQRPYVTALIVPNFELVETWCEQHAIHYTSPEYMVHNIKVKELFQDEIDRLNEGVHGHERVRKFILCHQDWTVESGEITVTLKPIRHLLMDHYQKAIEEMYEE